MTRPPPLPPFPPPRSALRCLLHSALVSDNRSLSAARLLPTDLQYDRWMEVQTNLQSWNGDFTQTRSLKVLAQPLVATGKVWVTPDEFRWDLGNPVQSVVLRLPDQLLILYPQLKRAEKYPFGRNSARSDQGRAGPAERQLSRATGRRWNSASGLSPRWPPIPFFKSRWNPAALPPARSSAMS